MILWDEIKNVSVVCKTFGISRSTIYRWLKRFDPKDIRSVKDKSRRPRWSYELIEAVKGLRQLYPRWGKEKLVVLLYQEGFKTSASTVGRIIAYLKHRGDLVEPKGPMRYANPRIMRQHLQGI
jgi:transposase